MTWNASAPGKLMLAGEYAVIDGGEAVMMAVDRRAIAELAGEPGPLSPFLEAAADQIERELGSDAADLVRRTVVDSSALRSERAKLGLGSSAAATVAAIGLATHREGQLDRALVHRLAHRAHRAAQARAGAPGSGADVAASVWGGLLVVRGDPAKPDRPLTCRSIELPAGLELVWVWTGEPADTAELVARVRALRDSRRVAYDQCAAAIVNAAAGLIAAFEHDDAAAAVQALAAGGDAVAALGAAAGVALESPIHQRLRTLADRAGGAVKPTGAGAGDVALAAFPDQEASQRFRADAESAGMHCPALRTDRRGVEAVLVSHRSRD